MPEPGSAMASGLERWQPGCPGGRSGCPRGERACRGQVGVRKPALFFTPLTPEPLQWRLPGYCVLLFFSNCTFLRAQVVEAGSQHMGILPLWPSSVCLKSPSLYRINSKPSSTARKTRQCSAERGSRQMWIEMPVLDLVPGL